ncbi:broad-complex core protein isoforms 1/2/3/4/5 isoform X4 [Frankliniella occidentalis]|uniref:Broad-complex core protein isoforms 1/2/3/4/5 isoform X4 n=1 Tax=Frankliniella occidentalis TaxID=133901 RepID=A0A6J1T864_FRAOC|nr:broad-complex core protein isoforms 1/2/3/4/5 isoform X4 [Frankliniella occidentalis]
MGSSQQFSLRWNNYLHHITSAFDSLRSDLDLVDVTLSCEGKKIKAHKMLLSACSSYFKDLFKENPCQHPVIVFRNVNFSDLEALIDFMYQGEVNVVQEQLASFLTTAELLAVQGLTDGNAKDLTENLEEENSEPTEETVTEIDAHTLKRTNSSTNNTTFNTPNLSPASPQAKRKKWSAPATASAASATSHKSRNSSNETKQLSRTSLSSGVNSVDIIPVLPQVKVEMPDFLEADSDQISFNNSEPVENPLEDISSLEHNLSAAVGSSKEESLDVYGGNSSDTGEITGEQMTPAELSQVLAKAGPSSEGSQDSLQGPPSPRPARPARWREHGVRAEAPGEVLEARDHPPRGGQGHALAKAAGHGKTCLQCRLKGRVTQRGSYVQTRFKCQACNVTLCRKNCFLEYHRERALVVATPSSAPFAWQRR